MPERGWAGGRIPRTDHGIAAPSPRAAPLVIAALALLTVPGSAAAATLPLGFATLSVDSVEIVWFAAFVGAIGFAVVASIALIRARARAERDRAALQAENAELKLAADRAEAVLASDDQRTVIWSDSDTPPEVLGALPETAGAPRGRAAFLAFGQWLEPRSAAALERAVAALREAGQPFLVPLRTLADTHIEASGRATGSRAHVRFHDLTRERLDQLRLAERNADLEREVALHRSLLQELPMPVWLRGPDRGLAWVNRAYARAVEAESATTVTAAGQELLDTQGREAVARRHGVDPVFASRLPVVVAGTRRVFDVVDVVGEGGSAGIAIDVSDLERVQSELRRTIESHARTLDQLATAVTIFGADKRLTFYNAAFRALFGLDEAFLAGGPEAGAVLDRLRAERKLPEQADFRSWKRDLLSALQAVEPQEFWWHLPGGQTLRVLATPHPQGGVTFVYENVTEQLDLESRYNTLSRVQRETLDHLLEGVAVFGSDGKLRLSNHAFATMWHIAPEALADRPHVNAIIDRCRAIYDDRANWLRLRTAVTGLEDKRNREFGRMERRDGTVIDFTTVPLPDGGTLITFVNVTDSVQVERALVERNEALEQADQLKNTFIQHVSYELRSPLTNIIGFAQLLGDPNIGPLNAKQREYTGYILGSSSSLLAIINDILDLATVDAGIMELELGDVDIAATVEAATNGLRDRLTDARLDLVIDVPDGIGSFVADEKRVRQVLFNLLSNAIAFSDPGGRIELAGRREGPQVLFAVRDYGQGIPEDYLDAVFERFESRTTGSRRRGPGLGLSIVKSFVELHGGTVSLDSVPGHGTTVVCQFPERPPITVEAAE